MESSNFSVVADPSYASAHTHVRSHVHTHTVHTFWDKLGIAVSSLCFVHCVIGPFLIMSVPFLSISVVKLV